MRRDRDRQAPARRRQAGAPAARDGDSAVGLRPPSGVWSRALFDESSCPSLLYERFTPCRVRLLPGPGKKMTGGAGLRCPRCLRSGRGQGGRDRFGFLDHALHGFVDHLSASSGPRVARGAACVAGLAHAVDRQPVSRTVSPQWARLGSNQRPLACEASALPLSYAPGTRLL